MRRVALIGLDAADGRLVERFVSEGRTPHLAKLFDKSLRFALRGNEPLGRSWEEFLLGRPVPDDMYVFDPTAYTSWMLGASEDPPFPLTDPPTRVLAFDLPYWSLRHEVPGWQVTCWGGQHGGYPRASRPQGLLNEIDRRFGPHPAGREDTAQWHDKTSISGTSAALCRGARTRGEIATWLLDRYPSWELFLTAFNEAHGAGEACWHGVERAHPLAGHATAGPARHALGEVYEAVDDAVGRITAHLPEDTVTVLFSFFGSCIESQDIPSTVLLPELLFRWEFGRPYLRPRGVDPNGPPVVPDASTWVAFMRRAQPMSLRQRVRGLLPQRRLRWSAPAWSEAALPETTLDPSEIGRPRHNPMGEVPGWYSPAWPRMRAFAVPTFFKGRVRMNVEGREARGVVAARDYLDVRGQIEALLHACRDPRSGQPVVERIDVAADDPHQVPENRPDLLVTWTGHADRWVHPSLGQIGPFPVRRTGGHTTDGFAWISGAAIEPGSLEAQPVGALAPTVLALLERRSVQPPEGRPIPLF